MQQEIKKTKDTSGRRRSASIDAMQNMDIPNDLVPDILTSLPVKSLLRFRCVCKSWCDLFANPDFISNHHHKQFTLNNVSISVIHEDERSYPLISVLKDDIVEENLSVTETILVPHALEFLDDNEVLGPCNGLLCLYDRDERIVLWNPSTREYKTVPLSPSRTASDADKILFLSIGFGFDSRTNDYKILRLSKRLLERSWVCQAELYSLKADSWREIPAFDSPNIGYLDPCFKTYNGGVYNLWDGERILSFDMANEIFGEMPCPNDRDYFGPYWTALTTFKGYLSIFGYLKRGLANLFHVWMMTKQGEKESWVKESIGPISGIDRPLGFWKNGGWFLQDTNGFLVLYDPSTQQLNNLLVQGVDRWLQVVNYVESLVRINDRQEDEDKNMPFVRTRMQNS